MELTPVSELFARDPMSLSDQDLDTIINTLRSQRHKFVLGDSKAGNMKPKTPKQAAATAKEKAAVEAAGDISLDDLGL
tara:strand:+ start:3714 stop:3947 length:234 start_codon:yes stop_codon:yes gene_type:complete